MKITLDSNPHDAPGCIKIIADNGQDRLIQTDWDWPGIASSFGWNPVRLQKPGYGYGADYYRPACHHGGTDGTIKCPDCGLTPSEFIESARQWLDDNDGAETDDPGYFDSEESEAQP